MRALPCVASFALVLLSAGAASAEEATKSYSVPMAVCEAAGAVPFVASTALLVGRFYVDAYRNNPESPLRNETETRVYLGTLALAGAGYVGCGPALHIAHGRPGIAALSATMRVGLPASAIAMVYGLESMRRPGEHFGDEFMIAMFAVVVVPGSIGLALAADHAWLARVPVVPMAAPTNGGASVGLAMRF